MWKIIFNSWLSLVIFMALVIFVPYRVSFFTFKYSDFWLVMCLFYQYYNGWSAFIPFNGRNFLKNFGLVMGITAVIGTMMQALKDGTPVSLDFLSHFYRFIRYLLIFKFVENILMAAKPVEIPKILNGYTLIGSVVLLFSFIEYNHIQPFSTTILSWYYIYEPEMLSEYLLQINRLSGIMGNPNATAIFITTTLIYPVFSLIKKPENLHTKIFFIIYILLGAYVIVVMTASRSSIIFLTFIVIYSIFISFSSLYMAVRNILMIAISILVLLFVLNTYQVNIEFSDRVKYLAEGKDSRGKKTGMLELTGRDKLWQDRIETFKTNADTFTLFFGMGYTKKYSDYADNGLLGSFLNLGFIGFIFRLLLYVITIKLLFNYSFKIFKGTRSVNALILSLVSFIFLAWELTADTVEHIKIGQLFFLFISAGFVLVSKKMNEDKLNESYSTHLVR
jgi:hypothetical protein